MKEKIITLITILLLSLALTACGGSAPQASDSQDGTDSGNSAAGVIQTLTDWYYSEERIQVEEALAGTAEAMGMTYSISVQEPDILIYNYQSLGQIDFQGASQEQIDAAYAESMQPYIETITPAFAAFREEYGISLRIVRLAYYNADGSLITALDITEDYLSPDASGGSSSAATRSLAEWIASEEADSINAAVNRDLTSSGMTFRLSAEENILIYEYSVSDALGFGSLSEEELTEHFGSVVESMQESLLSLFDLFRDEYGIALDAVRVVFLNENGSEILYTSELP
ncbi:MAG: DUF4854 domain-containing protein [Roseburia sp.]|nr:DUF4854 domain-containing protein [Roseburia sp.]MCM1097262.1 DUF4854 domain-containing protein [Ruminococcus flavefaciens]